MLPKIISGNLIDQDVEVIVNSWNRNIFPHWLLWAQGVSAAIKKKAGRRPFAELSKFGMIPLGKAVITSSGDLPYKAIIHVAGINLLWRASHASITESVKSVMRICEERAFDSVAFPLIGSGSGGIPPEISLKYMLSAFSEIAGKTKVSIVIFVR